VVLAREFSCGHPSDSTMIPDTNAARCSDESQ
jgi:hypothetical protein